MKSSFLEVELKAEAVTLGHSSFPCCDILSGQIAPLQRPQWLVSLGKLCVPVSCLLRSQNTFVYTGRRLHIQSSEPGVPGASGNT